MRNIAQLNRRLAEALEIRWILADYPENSRRRRVPPLSDVELCEVQPDERQDRVTGYVLAEKLLEPGHRLLVEAVAHMEAADSPECPERTRTVGITSSRLFQPEDRRLDLLRSDRDASAAFRREEDSGRLHTAAG